MAYTTIDKPDDYFNTVLYTGDDVDGRAITTGFQTDWTWIKRRNDTNSHIISDIVRGATYKLDSSSTSAEVNNYDGGHLESFTSTGFTLGEGSVNSGHTNATGGTYVSWNWKAGGTAVSNTAGSITTNASVNTTAGFSIVTYTGTGSNATIGHGLGVKPDAVFFKRLDTTGGWASYHSVLGATKYMRLDSTSAEQTATDEFQDTEPTVDEISIGTDGAVNGTSMVAYCFAEVKGFSKFGSYTGNGSTDGTFVNLGFRPAFIMIKRTDSTSAWNMWDNKRVGFNINNWQLEANTSVVENVSLTRMVMLSNGFKCNTDNAQINASGGTYIYMAFAENPFVTSTSIPTTAR